MSTTLNLGRVQGYSAYEVAVQQGYIGTRDEWLASLKGEKGDTGATGPTGPQGPKGDQGNTGSSVDYPYELVNNVTTDDATKGLSAAQGVVLDGKITELGQQVLETKNNIVPHDVDTNYIDKNTLLKDSFIDEDGTPHHFDGFYATDYVELEEGVTYYFDNLFNGYYAFYDENRNVIVAHGNDQSLQSPFTIPNGAKFGRFTIVSTAHTLDSWIFTSNAMPKAFKKSLNADYWPENIDKEWKEGIEGRLNDIVIHNPISNYIDRNKIKSDCYIDEHGSEVPYSGMFATDYIGLENNVQYYFDNVYSGYYAFYNSEKELVEGHGNDQSLQSPFTIPASARYARFTILNALHTNDCWISINNSIPPAYSEEINPKYLPEESSNIYCDYKGNEFSLFNKCLCIGDSMTSGTFNYSQQGQGDGYIEMAKYSYPTFLKKLTGVETVNMGVGGYTSVQWWNAYKDEDLSGYDIALIQLGINDLSLGGWTQASIDAFTNIINKLKAENTGIKIFITTIIPALAYPKSRHSAISAGIRTLVQSLNDENVILADLAIYGHTADSVAYSCGHLSAYGYLRLARDWKGIVGYIVNTNKNLFRKVQFIGTNYNYTDPY